MTGPYGRGRVPGGAAARWTAPDLQLVGSASEVFEDDDRSGPLLPTVQPLASSVPSRVAVQHHTERAETMTMTDPRAPRQFRTGFNDDVGKPPFRRAYGFALATGALFLLSWIGQFVAQAVEVRNEAEQHGSSFTWGDFLPQFLSATFENWQSEFLQLIWQAVGLALLLLWGSSQSKESDERIEAKLDRLLAERGIDPGEVSREVNEHVAERHGRGS